MCRARRTLFATGCVSLPWRMNAAGCTPRWRLYRRTRMRIQLGMIRRTSPRRLVNFGRSNILRMGFYVSPWCTCMERQEDNVAGLLSVVLRDPCRPTRFRKPVQDSARTDFSRTLPVSRVSLVSGSQQDEARECCWRRELISELPFGNAPFPCSAGCVGGV